MTDERAKTASRCETRRRAEDLARERQRAAPDAPQGVSAEESRQLIHDLRVHQIELEMQNHELRETQLALENVRAEYFDLYDLAPVGYCTLGATGVVERANLTLSTLLGSPQAVLIGAPFTLFILAEDQDPFYLLRRALELGAYLNLLTTELLRGQSRSRAVRLVRDLAPVYVPVDQAIPCGLIVNELLTNSLKHAFAGDTPGEIAIHLQREAGQEILLRVTDTGPGLPDDFDARKERSLGMQLGSDLARQIGGHVEVGPGPGARFDVKFQAP